MLKSVKHNLSKGNNTYIETVFSKGCSVDKLSTMIQ